MMDVGGLFFDFEPFRTEHDANRGRGGGVARHAVDAAAAMASPRDHRDAVVMVTRASAIFARGPRRRRDAVVVIT